MGAVRAALLKCAADVAVALLGTPNRQLSGRRELRFGKKGSLGVVIAGVKAGCWYDHEMGIGGDIRLADETVIELLTALRKIAEQNVAEVERVVRTYFEDRDSLEPVSRKELLDRWRAGAVRI